MTCDEKVSSYHYHRTMILWLLLIALPLTPAFAGPPATRPLDDIMKYQLQGVNLSMTIAQACQALEKNGFKADDPNTPAAKRLFWTYRRDNLTVGLQRHADDETLLVNITATLLPEKRPGRGCGCRDHAHHGVMGNRGGRQGQPCVHQPRGGGEG